MATVHFNLENLISKKIDEKLEEVVSKAVESAFSNIKFDLEPLEDKKQVVDEGNDECKQKQVDLTEIFDEAEVAKEVSEGNKSFKLYDPNKKEYVEVNQENKAYVNDNVFMNYELTSYLSRITEEMQRLLSNEYSHYYGRVEGEVSDDQRRFTEFIQDMTWEVLDALLSYRNINPSDLLAYNNRYTDSTQMPINAYYEMIRLILRDKFKTIFNVENLNFNEDDDTYFEQMLASELLANLDSLLDIIIIKYNKEIFDYLFGQQYYMGEDEI